MRGRFRGAGRDPIIGAVSATDDNETSGGDRPIRLVHLPPAANADAAAPGVLVTAWLLAELADSPAVLVEQVGPDEIHLRPTTGSPDAATVSGRLAALLADVRFAGWTAAADTGVNTTGTLLERDVPHRAVEADSS